MTTRTVRRTPTLVAVLAAVLAVTGCNGSDPGDGGRSPTDTSPSPGVSTTPEGVAGGGSNGGPGGGSNGSSGGGSTGIGQPPEPAHARDQVAVYYLSDRHGTTDLGLGFRARLYREFHTLDVGDGSPAARVRAAVTEMLTPGSAFDPDFASGWPETARVRSVEMRGGTAVVDLTGVSSPSTRFGPVETEPMAVQQLIWTATAQPGVDGVTLLVDGRAVETLWGGVSLGPSMRRGHVYDVVALMWLISPQHDQRVPGTFEVHLYGAPFEATAQLRVRQGSRVVHEQFVMLGGSGFPENFGEAKVRITLPPGTYTIEAFEYSARDGSVIWLDDKVITVG